MTALKDIDPILLKIKPECPTSGLGKSNGQGNADVAKADNGHFVKRVGGFCDHVEAG